MGCRIRFLEQAVAFTLARDAIYSEEYATGSAEMEIVNFDGDVETIRSHLYQQFGSGAGGDIHAKEVEYDAGMPEKGQPAFPKGVDMPEKLRQLESRKKLCWDMCKPAKRSLTFTVRNLSWCALCLST